MDFSAKLFKTVDMEDQVRVGTDIRSAPLTLTPRGGIRLTGVSLDDFHEGGSDLALNVHGVDERYFSLLADLDFNLNPRNFRGEIGDEASSDGIGGILSLAYSF